MDKQTKAKTVSSKLHGDILRLPETIRRAPGIVINGRRIKSILYSDSLSLIANTDADAILLVYPATPDTRFVRFATAISRCPILAGVGGGLTKGKRCGDIAFQSESEGAAAVVLNGPADLTTTQIVSEKIDVPVIYTVINKHAQLDQYIENGVSIFNVAGGKDTVDLVKWVREQYPTIPIIASGGNTDESIAATIAAGADAITYTGFGEMERIFHAKMEKYRKQY